MPIYEYRCSKCGQTFDKLFASHQKMTESKVACPHCHSKRVKRLISASRVNTGRTVSDDGGADDAPTSSGLLGRKEIVEITKKRKQAGLPG
jgi:putative FmdB family regulatory protein